MQLEFFLMNKFFFSIAHFKLEYLFLVLWKSGEFIIFEEILKFVLEMPDMQLGMRLLWQPITEIVAPCQIYVGYSDVLVWILLSS